MKGIISLGLNFQKRVEVTIENQVIVDYAVKEFDQYNEVTAINKPYFFAVEEEGQREFTEEEFEQFLIDNDKLIDLFNDIDLIYQTTQAPAFDDRKIKRSVDFYENQIIALKKIGEGNFSANVRQAVDEYIIQKGEKNDNKKK